MGRGSTRHDTEGVVASRDILGLTPQEARGLMQAVGRAVTHRPIFERRGRPLKAGQTKRLLLEEGL